MSKILYVKAGTKNVFGILGVEVRQAKKKRKVKRERLPPSNETPLDDDDEYDVPLEERLAYIARMRRGCRYVPKTPKSG